MMSTVFNPCFDVLSGFLSAWNERGWIVKQGNLKSDYQIFFFCLRLKKLLTYFLSSTVWFDTIVIFTRESSLILVHLHNFFLNCF